MAPIIEVQNLKKYFSTPRGMLHAVDDVSFTMERGMTMGVVGESGCGKTTLGRTLLHLLPSNGGKILFEGEDITKVKSKRLRELREQMQIIFQDPFSSLNPRMTISETLAEPLLLRGGMSKSEISDKIKKLMDTVGLAGRLANTYPHELDGGRRQRIGVARAIALDPKFIVCDEPVSALDVSIQAQILNLMQDLQEERGLTYMFITHDLSVVRYISNEICVMYLGEIVEKCAAKKLFIHQLHPYTKALLSAIPIPDPHARKQRVILQGEITSPITPKPGCRFMARCIHAMEKCSQPQKLDEVMPSHFVSCCRVRELNTLEDTV